MADIKNNEILTRIQLKYDSYGEWTSKNPTLLPGEVAIAKLVNDVTVPVEETKNAPVLFKVGPGAFNSLPWVSGLAADVYAWAKKATPDWSDFPALPIEVEDKDTGKFITDITYANNKITITRADGVNSIATTDDDVVILTVDKSTGDVTVDAKHAEKGVVYNGTQETKSISAFGEEITIKVPKLGIDKYGHTNSAQDIEYKISLPTPEAATNTITTVEGKEAIEVEDKATDGNHAYEVSLKLDNSGNVTFTQGDDGLAGSVARVDNADHADAATKVDNALTVKVGGKDVTFDGSAAGIVADVDTAIGTALEEAKQYADNNDANTAHTHKVGNGLTQTGNGDISGEVLTSLNLAFKDDKENKLLQLVDGTDNTKVIASFDTTEFIADGMLQKVEVDAEANKLVFTWNTNNAEGQTVTEIELDKIADIYTAAPGAQEVQVSISNKNVVSATLVNGGVAKTKLAADVQASLAKADTALQAHQDISGKKDKQESKNYDGSTAKTVTNVAQNENGEITVTYGDIAFPAAPIGTGAVAFALEDEGVVTINGGVKLNDHTLEKDDDAPAITLAKVAKTGDFDDLVNRPNHNSNNNSDDSSAYNNELIYQVTQTNGAVSTKKAHISDVLTETVVTNYVKPKLGLANIATSGDVKDLKQTAGTYIVFNCGTASTVI